MLHIAEIWRFPVKSVGGERVERAEIGPDGIAGDRQWGVRDLATGMILTGRREPRLLMATARLLDRHPVIVTADGREIVTSTDLASWLDRPVELVAAGQHPGTYENPNDIDNEDDWISWQGRPGSYHDGRSTVSLVSTGSLGDHEPRRFRINLLLHGADEEALAGRELTVGSARLLVRRPITRCIMIARAQPGIPADLSVLKRVIRERDNLMGVGAEVVSEGTITVGDALQPDS